MTAVRLGIRDPGPPYAEVGQIGRWSWTVRVIHGITQVRHSSVVGTRARADRLAARWLRRYLAEEERTARTSHRVTA